ncbi:Aste57867_15107 [Aphanomyces stellatus]|uniref:Aste57867_15107 protein n=1 Tax=Aphanomyces stellatus TaxID=120398 RepID=A0A485L470_9STRA|nr:hypothetical protein As57867_015051 [Aphanomyces stellatus]VFT91920.1 Aste57867_15107 [Aphanomyces stellatus]
MPTKDVSRNEALLSSMTQYSVGNYVREVMQVMMERVIKEQPHEPLEFLINVVRNDPRIDALDTESRFRRMDLRRVATKKKHLRAVFAEMVRGKDRPESIPREACVDKLLASKCLRQAFPHHAQDIVQVFGKKDTPKDVSVDIFVALSMTALARPFALQ